MHKALTAAALSLLIGPLFISTASAHKQAVLTPQMLQQVEQARAALRAPPAKVARHGTLQIKAKFDLQSKVTLPVRCYADVVIGSLSQPTSVTPSELSQDGLATFSDTAGSCTISMDYDWPSIDADAFVFITLDVETDSTAFFTGGDLTKPVNKVVTIGKLWQFNNNSIPAANGVTVYNFGKLPL